MKKYISAYMDYMHDSDKYLDKLIVALNNWRKEGATESEIAQAEKLAKEKYNDVYEP